jgi:hypothetical protein
MVNFIDFGLFFDNINNFLTGSFFITGLMLIFIFLIIFISLKIKIHYSLFFVLPFVAFLVGIGWINSWIFNVFLIIGAVIYAYVFSNSAT